MSYQNFASEDRTMADTVLLGTREARLRPEWTDLYPGIQPGIWTVAASLLPLVLRHRVLNEGGWEFARRILEDDHFEFRGGRPRDSGWTGLLTRVEDR
jgi:hypothetical protein